MTLRARIFRVKDKEKKSLECIDINIYALHTVRVKLWKFFSGTAEKKRLKNER